MALSDCPNCWDTPCTCGYNLSKPIRTAIHKMANALKPYAGRDPEVDSALAEYNALNMKEAEQNERTS